MAGSLGLSGSFGRHHRRRVASVAGFAAALVLALPLAPARAVELNPAAITIKLPDQIPWGPVNALGGQQAVLVGDPSKEGFYAVMVKWTKGNHFSRPHFHPHDRFITVLSGTWWVGTGNHFDPDHDSVPVPAGSFVVHTGKEVHWDGGKDQDVVLLIVGEGPETPTSVEMK